MSVPSAIARIPVQEASLPEKYQHAKQALSECARVDECTDWADKALALSSYARQAQDETLEKLAMRIRARAIRRAGELLRMFDGRGGDRKSLETKTSGGQSSDPPKQRDAAERAGLSSFQQHQATAVARIPEDEFEAAVESEDPPSVTRLAEMGRRPGFKKATQALGSLREFVRFCDRNDPAETAAGVTGSEIAKAKNWVAQVDAWLDRFVVNLPEDAP